MKVFNRFYTLMLIVASLSFISCGDEEENNSKGEEEQEQEETPEEVTVGGEVADAVDLGLSVKWASHNLGASSPEEDGGLYGWGDPTGNRIDKYVPAAIYDKNISGTKYDIARVHWGGNGDCLPGRSN